MGKGFAEGNGLQPHRQPLSLAREALHWVDQQNDLLGLAIDAGVKRPVAALRMQGVRTSQSCEGHTDRALPFPWIDVVVDDLPELEKLLADNPLPGFSLQVRPGAARLMPSKAVSANTFSLLASLPDDVQVEPDFSLRESQLAELAANRRRLAEWADRLLGKPA